MLQIFRALSKISVSMIVLKTSNSDSVTEYIKNLRQKYDLMIDLMLDDKKLKEELM